MNKLNNRLRFIEERKQTVPCTFWASLVSDRFEMIFINSYSSMVQCVVQRQHYIVFDYLRETIIDSILRACVNWCVEWSITEKQQKSPIKKEKKHAAENTPNKQNAHIWGHNTHENLDGNQRIIDDGQQRVASLVSIPFCSNICFNLCWLIVLIRSERVN